MPGRKKWLAFLATAPPCECDTRPRCTQSGWIRCDARLQALHAWEQVHGPTTPVWEQPMTPDPTSTNRSTDAR